MFNPGQLADWTQQLAANPTLERFGRHSFSTVVARLAKEPQSPLVWSAQGKSFPPAQIFGRPYDANCLAGVGDHVINAPAPVFTVSEFARVIGFSALLTQDGRLFAPEEITAGRKEDFLRINAYNHQGFLFEDLGDALKLRFASRPQPSHNRQRALFFTNVEPGNYGSFMFRQFPQMLLAANRGIDCDCYIVPERTSWLAEAFSLARLPYRPVFTTSEVCGDSFEAIITISGIDIGGFIIPSIKDLFQQIAREGQARLGPSELGERIYVSRSLSAVHRPWYRVMRNEVALESVARARGYSVVYPEILSLSDQARTFAHATRVIGPSGSGMFNTAYAKSGARVVDIETFHVTVSQHAALYSSSGHAYAFLFCQPDDPIEWPPINNSYVADESLFNRALDWLA